MKLKIIFKQLNPDYNQDYADQYEQSEESNNNMKSHWLVQLNLIPEID